MTAPLVSVVMPVYNGEKYLKEAIDSILNQTFRDFEFIIIDDSSVDSTSQIIEECFKRDIRIRSLLNSKNKGVAESLNIALSQAQSSLIVRMDADDIAKPYRIHKLYQYMCKHPDVTVCGSALDIYEQPGNIWLPPLTHDAIKAKILFESCLFHPTIIFRKDIIINNGGYEAFYTGVEDFELWQRLSQCSNVLFANIPDSLLVYRVHTGIDRSSYKMNQKMLANIVRYKALEYMGVSKNKLKSSRYEMFSNTDSLDLSLDYLCFYHKCLNEIEIANEIRNIYSPSHLKEELNYRWLRLCLEFSYKSPLISIKYLISKWTPISYHSFYYAIQMLYRAFKKKY